MPLKVLLVDDHPLLILVMKRFLAQKESLSIAGEASSGEEALLKVQELEPDVMVLDIRLPDISGFLVASEVARKFPKTKIVMVSAQLDPEAARKALEAGAQGVIPKDNIFEELSQAINKVARNGTYVSASIAS